MPAFLSKIFVHISPQHLFNIIYGTILISPLIGGEYTAVLALTGYLNFILIAKDRHLDKVAVVCFAGFLISLFTAFTLLVVHWEIMISEPGRPHHTLINVGWFALAFMIIDAVRFQVAYYTISVQNFAKFTLILVLISIFLKIIWIYCTGIETGLSQFFEMTTRTIWLVNLNPNHADNIVLFQITLVVWAVLMLNEHDNLKFVFLTVAATICSYMSYLLVAINSRAAFIGIFCAILVAFLLNVKNISLAKGALILAGLISIMFLMPESVTSRFETGSRQLFQIVNTANTELKQTISSRQQDAKLRSKIIEALTAENAEKSTGQRVLNLCYDGQFAGGLAQQYKTDPNLSYRLLLLFDGYNLWKIHPYFGHGTYDRTGIIKNYSTIDICRIGLFSHLHNHYLDLMVRGGVFALSAFLILSGLFISLIVKDRSASNRPLSYGYLPVLMYFTYLYTENFFDISFHRYAPLSAVLFSLAVLISVNLNYTITKSEHRPIEKQ